MNKYKILALLISVIFIFSVASAAIYAHPGHGSEYAEEVTSSDAGSSSHVSGSGGGSPSSGSSSSGSSGSHVSGSGGSSSGSSGSYVSGSGGSSSASFGGSSGSSSDVGDNLENSTQNDSNSSIEEVNSTTNDTNSDEVDNNASEENNFFTLSNIILLVCFLLCGFFAVIILSKVFFKWGDFQCIFLMALFLWIKPLYIG